jgi:IS30 family transposase
VPRYAPNKAPLQTKRQFFELIRQGLRAQAASLIVGVSPSCGSVWFVDAGRVSFVEHPISRRYLTQDDRIEIAEGLAAGEPVKSIAERIGKSFQSVYREIQRNSKPDGRYQPWFAHNQAYLRRRRAKQRRFIRDERLRSVVARKLELQWSPALISRWLRRRWPKRRSWHVCPETIYEAVYRGLIMVTDALTLRTGRVYRHRRGRGRSREGALKQSTAMKTIHQRPAIVETREQIGHWEGDLIIGGGQRSAIATLVERKSRLTLLTSMRAGYSAQKLGDQLIALIGTLPPAFRRTLTWDQGNEMFHHERIEQAVGIKIFFADPHSPWQRGTNENTNGLLRQYFPKGMDLRTVTDDRLREVMQLLNQRPRLVLGDRTPEQVMGRWRPHFINL